MLVAISSTENINIAAEVFVPSEVVRTFFVFLISVSVFMMKKSFLNFYDKGVETLIPTVKKALCLFLDHEYSYVVKAGKIVL